MCQFAEDMSQQTHCTSYIKLPLSSISFYVINAKKVHSNIIVFNRETLFYKAHSMVFLNQEKQQLKVLVKTRDCITMRIGVRKRCPQEPQNEIVCTCSLNGISDKVKTTIANNVQKAQCPQCSPCLNSMLCVMLAKLQLIKSILS